MKRNKPRQFKATEAEYLGIAAGEVNGRAIATLSLRPRPKQNFTALNLTLERPALERLREDIDFLLNHSPLLKAAEGREEGVSLADIELLHYKLTD